MKPNGLDAVREVATHWRRRYQAAQALLAETQRENRHLEDGLIDAHRVIRDYRKIEQNATSTLEELVESLDSMESERDDYKLLYENKRDQHKAMLREFWQMSNERR